MQILASALPGFRDLRAPLTAGYLWLVLLWLVLKPDIATRPKNEIAGAVWDLGHTVGPIWVGLAAGITAYLIGAVSQVISPVLNWMLETTWDKIYGHYEMQQLQGKRLPRPFVNYHRDPVDKYDLEAAAKFSNNPPRDEEGEYIDTDATVGQRGYQARRGVAQEISLPATLLLGKEPQLYTEADRLKAESQFRLAIVPPLTAILAFVAYSVSWWWLIGLLPILIILWQSHVRNLEYRYLMFGAIERGLVISESLEEYKSWVNAIRG